MATRIPQVAIVIPAYNAESTLDRAIESALIQTASNIELFIVDDGSTDRTLNVAAKWKSQDSRITVVGCKRHHGMAYAFNKGVRKSTAPLIAKFDADDYSDPNRIRSQLKKLSRDDNLAAIGLGTITVVGDRYTPYVLELATVSAEIAIGLLFRPELLCGTTLYRRSVLKQHPFPEHIPVGAGRLHAHHLVKAGFKIENLKTENPLFEYHRGDLNNLPRAEGHESDLMLRAILADLDIDPTVANLQTHRAASRALFHGIGQHPLFQAHLSQNSTLAKKWFSRLERANFERNPHFYDTQLFSRIIAEQIRELEELN